MTASYINATVFAFSLYMKVLVSYTEAVNMITLLVPHIIHENKCLQ